LNTALREQMLASATEAVNALCTFAQDQPVADFDAREEQVLAVGRGLLATWLGQLAGAAGPRTPACPECGVHSLNAVRRRRKPRTLNSRCGTVHIPRIRLTCRGCGHSWLPLQSVLGVGPQQRTSGGLQHWEALLGGLTIFAEAARLLETLAGVQVGIETLRTHAEAAGTELEGEQRAAIAHVQATQEPPPGYAPVAETQTLVVETDGVMARYRDRHLDGTLIEGEWHEIKLGLAGGWQDGQLVSSSYVAARESAADFRAHLKRNEPVHGSHQGNSARPPVQSGAIWRNPASPGLPVAIQGALVVVLEPIAWAARAPPRIEIEHVVAQRP
jgi:hypothetical protein